MDLFVSRDNTSCNGDKILRQSSKKFSGGVKIMGYRMRKSEMFGGSCWV